MRENDFDFYSSCTPSGKPLQLQIAMRRVGTIAELWRYPVKSMHGERVTSVALDAEGIRGDRRFAFESTRAPLGKPLLNSRERAAMLLYTGRLKPEPVVVDAQGQESILDPAAFSSIPHDDLSAGTLALVASPSAPLTDVRPVSLLSLETVRQLSAELGYMVEPERFRANILLHLQPAQPFGEDAWPGQTLQFGDGNGTAQLLLTERIPRCRMVSLHPQTAVHDPLLLRHLAHHHQGRVGVYGRTGRAGMLREGDAVFLLQAVSDESR